MVEAITIHPASGLETMTMLGEKGLRTPPNAWSEPIYIGSQTLLARKRNIIMKGSLVSYPVRKESYYAVDIVLGVTEDGRIAVAGGFIDDKKLPLQFTTLAKIVSQQNDGTFKSHYFFLVPAHFGDSQDQ